MAIRRKYRTVAAPALTIVALLALLAGAIALGGTALAQAPRPDTGDGAPPMVVPQGDNGDGLPARATNAAQQAQALGPDADPMVSFSYFRLVGPAFQPRTSATTFGYDFNGCIHTTGGTDNRYMAPLLVPDEATIKFLRVYYYDNLGSNVTAWITRYQPGAASEDLVSVTSLGAVSTTITSLSAEITHTVDLHDWAYTVVVAPNATSVDARICGVRVAYYAPSIFGSFMPLVSRQ